MNMTVIFAASCLTGAAPARPWPSPPRERLIRHHAGEMRIKRQAHGVTGAKRISE
jgi:hypothetical protein